MSEPRTRARVTILLFTFAALSLVFLSACQKREKDDLDDFDPNEPVKLKVMYILEETFGQTYGNLLQRKFPNLELEIVAPGLGTFTIDDYLQRSIRNNRMFSSLAFHSTKSLPTQGVLWNWIRSSSRIGSI